MNDRFHIPLWHHDAYAVRRLASALDEYTDSFVAPKKHPIAADLGCGDQPYRALFEAHGCQYIGCDLEGGGGEVVISPGKPIPMATGSADLVVSIQVLEHVWDLDWYLAEARRLLRDDGILLLSTHGTWPYHPHPTDFRRWTRIGLAKEMESRGFRIAACRSLVGPLAWSSLFRCIAVSTFLRRVPLIGSVLSGIASVLWYPWLRLADAMTPQAWTDDNAAIYVLVAHPTASA